MISRIQPNALADPAQASERTRQVPTRSNPSFLHSLVRTMNPPATNGRSGGNSVPTPQVVQSPFNVLGLPVSSTAAPTAAEVAANPQKYAGTSFDPNRYITPYPRQAPPAAEAPASTAPGSAHLSALQVPEGSRPTMNPNVYIMASGATWFRPGTTPNNATDADYQNWRRSTFG